MADLMRSKRGCKMRGLNSDVRTLQKTWYQKAQKKMREKAGNEKLHLKCESLKMLAKEGVFHA